VRVVELSLRDVRTYERARVQLGSGLTIVTGRNGAGKTNLLEGLYFACTGRSCRTNNDRELIRFDAPAARAEAVVEGTHGRHRISAAIERAGTKRVAIDGATADAHATMKVRPAVCVFLPDRLELVKGGPSLRRAHLDQVVSALYPARAAARREYGKALAQRNALLGRVRSGASPRTALTAWTGQLARAGMELMRGRELTVEQLSGPFSRWAEALGLEGGAELSYAPRSHATDAAELAAELEERLDADLERGFTGHGPHRDELRMDLAGRPLRAYGSQGQQRMALLALLMAEREALSEARGAPPLMLLDDVTSELDAGRRERLVEALRSGGQALLTATEPGQIPGAQQADVVRLAVTDGRVLADAPISGAAVA
jgi:DNA replication and repair protein RecF